MGHLEILLGGGLRHRDAAVGRRPLVPRVPRPEIGQGVAPPAAGMEGGGKSPPGGQRREDPVGSEAGRFLLPGGTAPADDRRGDRASGPMTAGPAGIRAASLLHPREPVRVLFVSHDAGMWGAQRTLLALLSGIDRSVCSPLLILPYDGPMRRRAEELRIPVFETPLVHWIPVSAGMSARRRVRHLSRFLKTLRSRCGAIERLIADHGIDLVYTNTVTCAEGAIAARNTRIPHVWHIHEHLAGNRELAPLFPRRAYCAAVGSLSKSVVFCSRSLARAYPQLARKASVVHNGLAVPPVRDRDAARAEANRTLDLDPGAKLVAAAGALHPGKDYLTLLDAAQQVALSGAETVFLIAGAGSESYTGMLRERIEELRLGSRVRLLGWRDDLQDLLAAVDVLVISSVQESFGLTAIEALAAETPVVSTRCGGPEEILENGSAGLLVPVKDPMAMADAIVRLLRDPELRRRMGERGRARVIEHFGVDRYVRELQRVILGTAAPSGE
ncbi:MAG: glycosyltransferase family 4 protein [Deltaproteobacteria bacterium]|nr:glycosyltransferase family 4 protein [Deltaproteobacteria bacterium]